MSQSHHHHHHHHLNLDLTNKGLSDKLTSPHQENHQSFHNNNNNNNNNINNNNSNPVNPVTDETLFVQALLQLGETPVSSVSTSICNTADSIPESTKVILDSVIPAAFEHFPYCSSFETNSDSHTKHPGSREIHSVSEHPGLNSGLSTHSQISDTFPKVTPLPGLNDNCTQPNMPRGMPDTSLESASYNNNDGNVSGNTGINVACHNDIANTTTEEFKISTTGLSPMAHDIKNNLVDQVKFDKTLTSPNHESDTYKTDIYDHGDAHPATDQPLQTPSKIQGSNQSSIKYTGVVLDTETECDPINNKGSIGNHKDTRGDASSPMAKHENDIKGANINFKSLMSCLETKKADIRWSLTDPVESVHDIRTSTYSDTWLSDCSDVLDSCNSPESKDSDAIFDHHNQVNLSIKLAAHSEHCDQQTVETNALDNVGMDTEQENPCPQVAELTVEPVFTTETVSRDQVSDYLDMKQSCNDGTILNTLDRNIDSFAAQRLDECNGIGTDSGYNAGSQLLGQHDHSVADEQHLSVGGNDRMMINEHADPTLSMPLHSPTKSKKWMDSNFDWGPIPKLSEKSSVSDESLIQETQLVAENEKNQDSDGTPILCTEEGECIEEEDSPLFIIDTDPMIEPGKEESSEQPIQSQGNMQDLNQQSRHPVSENQSKTKTQSAYQHYSGKRTTTSHTNSYLSRTDSRSQPPRQRRSPSPPSKGKRTYRSRNQSVSRDQKFWSPRSRSISRERIPTRSLRSRSRSHNRTSHRPSSPFPSDALNRKVCISCVPSGCSGSQLVRFLERVGPVTSIVERHLDKGTAIVLYSNSKCAARAITELSGKTPPFSRNRVIVVQASGSSRPTSQYSPDKKRVQSRLQSHSRTHSYSRSRSRSRTRARPRSRNRPGNRISSPMTYEANNLHRQVYVSSLPTEVNFTEQELIQYMQQVGPVSSVIFRNPQKGTAIILYRYGDHAARAIAELSGKTPPFSHRRAFVIPARGQKVSLSQFSPDNDHVPGRDAESTVVVSNLPNTTTYSAMRQLLRSAGLILNICIDPSVCSEGITCMCVTFKTKPMAMDAVRIFDKTEYRQHILRVNMFLEYKKLNDKQHVQSDKYNLSSKKRVRSPSPRNFSSDGHRHSDQLCANTQHPNQLPPNNANMLANLVGALAGSIPLQQGMSASYPTGPANQNVNQGSSNQFGQPNVMHAYNPTLNPGLLAMVAAMRGNTQQPPITLDDLSTLARLFGQPLYQQGMPPATSSSVPEVHTNHMLPNYMHQSLQPAATNHQQLTSSAAGTQQDPRLNRTHGPVNQSQPSPHLLQHGIQQMSDLNNQFGSMNRARVVNASPPPVAHRFSHQSSLSHQQPMYNNNYALYQSSNVGYQANTGGGVQALPSTMCNADISRLLAVLTGSTTGGKKS